MLTPHKSTAHWAFSGTLAVTVLVAASCAHRVEERPNVSVRTTVGQVLLLENLTGAPLVLLPAMNRGETNRLTLQQGEFARLVFTLNEQQNAAAAGERELVLVPEKTSPCVSQSAIDLVVRAQFGTSTIVRELRITPGFCLFETNAANTVHAIPVRSAPLAGVPLKRLCPAP